MQLPNFQHEGYTRWKLNSTLYLFRLNLLIKLNNLLFLPFLDIQFQVTNEYNQKFLILFISFFVKVMQYLL